VAEAGLRVARPEQHRQRVSVAIELPGARYHPFAQSTLQSYRARKEQAGNALPPAAHARGALQGGSSHADTGTIFGKQVCVEATFARVNSIARSTSRDNFP
jgi:hypothetical protein